MKWCEVLSALSRMMYLTPWSRFWSINPSSTGQRIGVDAPGVLELFGSYCASAAVAESGTTGQVTYYQDSSHQQPSQHKSVRKPLQILKVSYYSITVSTHGQMTSPRLNSLLQKLGKEKKNKYLSYCRKRKHLNMVAMTLAWPWWNVLYKKVRCIGGGGWVTNGKRACAWIMLRASSGAVCAEVISPDQQRT